MEAIPRHLEDILKVFKESVLDGVPGVMRIEAETPGPVLGITACTHGNEPPGLAIFARLLNELGIATALKCGTLYLVLNNIAAAEDFFAATTSEKISRARYRDVNMNRLPRNVLDLATDDRYEVRRSRELYPIWKRFTVGLDIHSTIVPTDPMLISRGGRFELIERLIRGFSIDVLISNIDQIQLGIPAFALYGNARHDVPVFAIEAGQHTETGTFKRAAQCSVALLQNLGMLSGIPEATVTDYREYLVDGSVIFPDHSFDFVADFQTYDAISENELLARNPDGAEIRAPFGGHLLFPTKERGKSKDVSEEVAFLSRPMKIRHVK